MTDANGDGRTTAGVDTAVARAREAQPGWLRLPSFRQKWAPAKMGDSALDGGLGVRESSITRDRLRKRCYDGGITRPRLLAAVLASRDLDD